MAAGHGGWPALALIAAVIALGGCDAGGAHGSGDGSAGSEGRGVGVVKYGTTAQFADCQDWRRGTVAERYATIKDIRGQLTPQESQTAESDLSDAQAYTLFQRSCANDYGTKFRLYKLYARAQGFAPLRTDGGD